MIEWPLLFIGGLLGSAHCVGMCGGFALTLGTHAPSWRSNLGRQLIYGGGRLFTYVALGAMAGYGGRKLVLAAPVVHVQAWLAVFAGMFLLWQGLAATGLLRRTRRIKAGDLPCLNGHGMLGTLLRTRGAVAPLAAGVLTGLLPCGLVYAFVALAVSSGTMERGMATMLAFGVGTLPMMTVLGLGTSLFGLTARQHLLRAAAWCVVITGVLSIARGAAAFQPSSTDATPACPLCSSRETLPSRTPNAAAAITTPEIVNSTTSNPTP